MTDQDEAVKKALAFDRKQGMMRDAALVALKRQTEWWLPDGGLYTPSIEEIQKRINQVVQYNDLIDPALRAMKELVISNLSCRLEMQQLRRDMSARTLWGKFKLLFRRV